MAYVYCPGVNKGKYNLPIFDHENMFPWKSYKVFMMEFENDSDFEKTKEGFRKFLNKTIREAAESIRENFEICEEGMWNLMFPPKSEPRFFEGKEVISIAKFEDPEEHVKIKKGDYVDEEIVNYYMDMLPPASLSRYCSQLGEPYSTKIDENGKHRNTYLTFTRVAENTWKCCGYCFCGEIEERGTEVQYV